MSSRDLPQDYIESFYEIESLCYAGEWPSGFAF